MRTQQPQPGLVELMDYLQARGLPRGLCTRNFEYVLFIYPFPFKFLSTPAFLRMMEN